MTLTWIFAVCLLNANGSCHAYIPQTNFAYMQLDDAKHRCLGMLKDFGSQGRDEGSKNVCIKGYQYDVSYGQGSYR